MSTRQLGLVPGLLPGCQTGPGFPCSGSAEGAVPHTSLPGVLPLQGSAAGDALAEHPEEEFAENVPGLVPSPFHVVFSVKLHE